MRPACRRKQEHHGTKRSSPRVIANCSGGCRQLPTPSSFVGPYLGNPSFHLRNCSSLVWRMGTTFRAGDTLGRSLDWREHDVVKSRFLGVVSCGNDGTWICRDGRSSEPPQVAMEAGRKSTRDRGFHASWVCDNHGHSNVLWMTSPTRRRSLQEEHDGNSTGEIARIRACKAATSGRGLPAGRSTQQSQSLLRKSPCYAVIPFVSAMNAVSRFNSSSRKSVSLKPASIRSVGRSL
jgi:hypothetical protein